MRTRLSTDGVAPRERLAYWIDAVCDTYVQLDCDALGEPGASGALSGEIVSDKLVQLQLSRVTATGQRVCRTPARIAATAEDYFLVSVQTQGTGQVVQDGRCATLGPGDFALYDSTRPYELRFERAFQQYVLMLPGGALRRQLRDTQWLTAQRVPGQRCAGHLVIGMIHTLVADMDTLEPASASAVADGLCDLLVAGLSTLPRAHPAPVSSLTALYREQVKDYVRRHLRDPGLSVGRIAEGLRVSPSTLHRAFVGEPCSIADWIWTQRLDAVRRELCDPAAKARSISELAFSWGFNDAAHFSRAFKARYGCAPRELREFAARAEPRASHATPDTRGKSDVAGSSCPATAHPALNVG
ncbi:helix-turn-helix domain-containing protein [Thiomonas sp.]|uniref:AraC-like ligand-binding domain-containing protein n=1 Tax=Thiomonas sp. TaxID=2047785 RepID=UPI00260E22EA|nr:helix-turn-helix domain-containing protein [Thiomonas sp.]